MSEDTVQLICAAVVTLCQVYYMNPEGFNVLARMWDVIARITGYLANILGHVSVQARANYFTAVNAYGA